MILFLFHKEIHPSPLVLYSLANLRGYRVWCLPIKYLTANIHI